MHTAVMRRRPHSAIRLVVLAVLCCAALELAHSMPAAPQEEQPQPKPLKVATDSLPQAIVGQYYGITVYASGGKRPYDFSATGLPDGLSISRNSDRIAGMPKTPGTSNVVITVEDSSQPAPNKAMATLQLTVAAAAAK